MFEFDIFLSYDPRNNTAGWVTEFRKALENALQEKLDKVQIFMDVEGGQAFDSRIENSLRKSAVLVIVVSEALLAGKQERCQKEREEFIRHVGGNTEGRIYLINYDEVDPGDLPAEIARLTPYDFFERDEATEDILPGQLQTAGRYHRALYSLRRDLVAALQSMTEAADQDGSAIGSAATVSPAADPLAVWQEKLRFLQGEEAIVSDSAQKFTLRKQIEEAEQRVSELEIVEVGDGPTVFLPEALNMKAALECYEQVEAAIAQQARVVPGRKSFFAAYDGFQRQVDSCLQQSDLFVQLLSPQCWPRAEAFEGGYERWLLERAVAHDVPVLRWFDPRLPLEYVKQTDPRHAEFLQLAGDKYGRLETCILSDFIAVIFQELDRQKDRRKYDVSGDGHPVLVVASNADQALGDEVGEELEDLGKVAPELLVCPDTMPFDVGREAAALTPRGLIIAWDQGPEPLLIDMMKQCRRYRKSRELRPPSCAVVVPSVATHSVNKRPPGFTVLGKNDQAGLQRLVNKMCGGGN